MTDLILKAPSAAMKNRQSIEQSQTCGCYHCLTIFSAKAVIKWTDQNRTGLCPNCEVDSILPDSEFPISTEVLQKAYNFWFDSSK